MAVQAQVLVATAGALIHLPSLKFLHNSGRVLCCDGRCCVGRYCTGGLVPSLIVLRPASGSAGQAFAAWSSARQYPHREMVRARPVKASL